MALILATALLPACSDSKGSGERTIPDNCGFPKPTPGMPKGEVPEAFFLNGEGRQSSGQKVRGGFVTTIDVPYSVQDALPLYKEAIAEEGFKIRSVDNEGFEAELYFEGHGKLGAIQIRRTTCADASIIFVNIVSRDSLSAPFPSPTPT